MSFTQREARAIVRKAVARVPEGEEIRHLNIMPMMDMMTILLVAFIYQAAVSATQLTAGTVSLPKSLSDDDLPEGASTVIITKTGIVVSAGKEAKSIVSVSNGDGDGQLVGIITESDLFKLFQELLGARKKGVRLTILLPEVRGTLAKITTAIAQKGGYIHALGTFLGEDPTNFLLTMKVADVAKDTLVETLKPLALEIIDVRET